MKTTKPHKTNPRATNIIRKLRVLLAKDKALKSSLQAFLA